MIKRVKIFKIKGVQLKGHKVYFLILSADYHDISKMWGLIFLKVRVRVKFFIFNINKGGGCC